MFYNSKKEDIMKIVVLIVSPNKNGSTNLIAKEFEKGAVEAGHQVVMLDVAHANVGVCGCCVACGYNGPCVKKDDMKMIKQEILSADMLFSPPRFTITECLLNLKKLSIDFVLSTAPFKANI